MLYTPVTKRAIRFCYEAHAGQLDKAGLPYVNHPLHLAEQMTTEDETCVALLHDVMEDCDATPEDLLALGLSHDAVAAVQLLTHKDGVPYLDYVRTVGENPIACRVKVADLRHNSDLARLDEVGPKDIARLRKYREARVILGDMAIELQTPAGVVSMESAGEPYPFEVRDQSDGAVTLEADVLPLSVGEKVQLRYDFGPAVAQGSGQLGAWRVYQTAGTTIGMAPGHERGGRARCYRCRGGVMRQRESPFVSLLAFMEPRAQKSTLTAHFRQITEYENTNFLRNRR